MILQFSEKIFFELRIRTVPLPNSTSGLRVFLLIFLKSCIQLKLENQL